MVFFDQSQGQVHSRCYAGGGIDVPVTNKYWIRVDVGAGAPLKKKFTPVPMSGCLASVQQAGSSQKHCASANRTNSPNSASDLPEPSYYFNAYFVVLDGTPSGYKQRVDLPSHIPKRPMGCYSQATIRN